MLRECPSADDDEGGGGGGRRKEGNKAQQAMVQKTDLARSAGPITVTFNRVIYYFAIFDKISSNLLFTLK